VYEVAIPVDQDVSVVPILDLQEICHDRVTRERLDEVALGTAEASRVGFAVCLSVSETSGTVFHDELTLTKWSMSETLPIGPPSAIRLAYSPFLIECTDTASVMVSTRPDCSPVIKIRKLPSAVTRENGLVTHKRTQQSLFSSLKIRLNRSMSCVASCSCRKSVPVLTITEMTSQFAK
jgi:hypothetical protein